MALGKKATMTIIAVTITGLLLALSATGVLGTPRGSGRVRAINVGAYLNPSCTVSCAFINWGNSTPGSVVTKTIYIKNLGSASVALQLSTANWSPKKATSIITLSWNLDNYLLLAEEVVPAVLTLTLASNAGSLREFNFVVVITGTQEN